MRTFFFFLLLAFPFFSFAQSKTEQNVLDTEQRRFNAMIAQDTVLLRTLLADDLVYIHSNTMTENKAKHISNISSGHLIYKKMTREQVQARQYGKIAITNGVVQVSVVLDDKPLELKLAYTAVYRKKGGTWQLVNWQSTKAP